MQGYKLPTEHGKGRWQEALGAMSGSGRPTAEDAATQRDFMSRTRCQDFRRTPHRQLSQARGGRRGRRADPGSPSQAAPALGGAASSISWPLLLQFPLTQTFCPHQLDSLSQGSLSQLFSIPPPTARGK